MKLYEDLVDLTSTQEVKFEVRNEGGLCKIFLSHTSFTIPVVICPGQGATLTLSDPPGLYRHGLVRRTLTADLPPGTGPSTSEGKASC